MTRDPTDVKVSVNTATATATATAQPSLELMPEIAPQPIALAAQAPVRTASSPLALIDIMMNSGSIDLDRAERLLKMAQDWRLHEREEQAHQAKLAFARDFALFRGENIIIAKTKFVDRGRAGSFMQAEFDQVCRQLSPALSKHGFSFRHDMKFGAKPWTTDGLVSDMPWVYVTCYLTHREGHCESLLLEGPPGDNTANTPVQNMQVTASVLKRQSLTAITGTATSDEDNEAALKQKHAATDRVEQELEALRDEGREKAMSGMSALTDWWGTLSATQRTKLSPDFTNLRRAAAMADKNGGTK